MAALKPLSHPLCTNLTLNHCTLKPPATLSAPTPPTLASGARQLVVQDALDTTLWDLGSYLSSLTPITNMGASAEGAEMTTFLAPAFMWGWHCVAVTTQNRYPGGGHARRGEGAGSTDTHRQNVWVVGRRKA